MINTSHTNTSIDTRPILTLPPKHSLSDYLVLILLSVCIAIGAPMTLMICWRLMQRLRLTGAFRCSPKFSDRSRNGSRRRRVSQRRTKQMLGRTVSTSSMIANNRRTDLLKLQLNIADLMVLIFYAFSKVCWTLTYKWQGGNMLCKLVRFLSVLSFHMCTNSVVCIGLDRMITLLRPGTGNRRRTVCAREYLMLAVSCTLAFVCSLPQFWIWNVVEVMPNWKQCIALSSPWLEVYGIVHLLTIFWIPCFIIAVSYIVIVVQVLLHLKENPHHNSQTTLEHEVIEENQAAIICHTKGTTTNEAHAGHRKRTLVTRLSIGRRILQCGRMSRFLCRQTLMILTVYILCWAPYNGLTLWIHFRPQDSGVYRSTVRFLQELIVVNSVINPFLYACDVYHQILGQHPQQKTNAILCCFCKCSCIHDESSDDGYRKV